MKQIDLHRCLCDVTSSMDMNEHTDKDRTSHMGGQSCVTAQMKTVRHHHGVHGPGVVVGVVPGARRYPTLCSIWIGSSHRGTAMPPRLTRRSSIWSIGISLYLRPHLPQRCCLEFPPCLDLVSSDPSGSLIIFCSNVTGGLLSLTYLRLIRLPRVAFV
jgi:hypothetical protein